RHIEPVLTPPQGVEQMPNIRVALQQRLLEGFSDRVREQPIPDEDEREERLRSVKNRIADLLDAWRTIFDDYSTKGIAIQYQKYELKQPRPMLHDMLEKKFDSESHRKFRV